MELVGDFSRGMLYSLELFATKGSAPLPLSEVGERFAVL